jgi:2-dehydro-3-deoxygalactonokinase
VKTGSPCLIALDWGSTSLRAFLMDDAGETLAERTSADGASQLAGGPAAFEQALRQLAGDWLAAHPAIAVVASGWLAASMAGARRNTLHARFHFRACIATRRRCRVVWAWSFVSSMTGELFAVLRQHLVLGRLMPSDAPFAGPGFDEGVRCSRNDDGRALSQRLFLARARALTALERAPALVAGNTAARGLWHQARQARWLHAST